MTQRFVRYAGVALLVVAGGSAAGETEVPRVLCLSPETLMRNKARVAAEDKILGPAMEQLRQEAESALRAKPTSVMDNDLIPPSGDKHDYVSFGPYWWPDTTKPDGLPYIRRDGEVNRDSRSGGSDWSALEKMSSAVQSLALAYYFTGDDRFALHAAVLLRTWFLDPQTKMNPNLNYGQGIPGRVDGRAEGIIDTVTLTGVVDAVGLLQGSSAWQERDQAGMIAWFAAYLDWLRTSEHGQKESAAANNHGTWYDVQVAAYALFVGQDQLATEVIEASRDKRIAREIQPDGRQPAELARTKPFGYSAFNLQALFTLAKLGERVNVDLWNYKTTDGRSLQKALDFLADYVDPDKAWPYKDLAFDRTRLTPLLQQGGVMYGDQYTQALQRLPSEQVSQSRGQLTYAR